MFNVDTIFLGMNFEDRQKEVEMLAGRTKVMTDYEYIKTVNEKIRNKLYLDDDNRRKLKKVIELKQMAKKSHHILTRKDLTRNLDIKMLLEQKLKLKMENLIPINHKTS